MRRRSLHQDDRAISEVLGFILSFALSAIFLMIALSSFYAARNNTDGIVAASELRSVADRVATRIVEAGLVGQEFPNATINLTLNIPQDLNGHPYQIVAKKTGIWVNASDATYSSMASVFKVDAVSGVDVCGTAYSGEEHLIITYSLHDVATAAPVGCDQLSTRDIIIHGD
jgi:hypothetical protein